jgi:hypothetical protein
MSKQLRKNGQAAFGGPMACGILPCADSTVAGQLTTPAANQLHCDTSTVPFFSFPAEKYLPA